MTDPVRHYQRVAAEFLSSRAVALLADAPRVGKTAAAIRACDMVSAGRVLWVTTGSARADHARAWKRFQIMDRTVQVIYDGKTRPQAEVVIISYDLLRAQDHHIFQGWDVLVLDEVHKLKSRESKRTKFVFGEECKGDLGSLVRNAQYVWGMSGTPAPNHYDELWPFLRACAPDTITGANGKPMAYWSFAERFCRMRDDGFGLKIVGNKNAADLRRRIAPLVLRRTLDDIAPEIPRLQTDVLRLGDLKAVHNMRRAEQDAKLAEMGNALTGLTPEQQQAVIAAAFKRIDAKVPRMTGLAKVTPIIDWLLDEAPEKIVVFCWHTEVLYQLLQAVGGLRCATYIDGSVTGRKRGEHVERFMTDPACRFFFGQIVAAGEAIDLSVADEILFAESSWVPGHNEQAAMRIVNVNKARPTLARFATIAGSIDEKVQSVAAAKLADIQKLFT